MPAVEVGKVYAAQAASEWHRIRVESVADDTCVCLFLDHGDTDTIALADLRQLKPEFLMLPPQAFPVQVSGLQEFQEREAKILPTVNQLLLGKSLMAKVEGDLFLEKIDANFVLLSRWKIVRPLVLALASPTCPAWSSLTPALRRRT